MLNAVCNNGLLNADSLANYKVVERVPLKSRFNDKTIYTNPMPSVGGTLITFTLQLLERAHTTSSTDIMNLVRAMQVTSAARKNSSTDPNDNYHISQILNENTFERYLEQYRSLQTAAEAGNNPQSSGATTQVSIIDKAGNAASVTTTNGEGCGYLIPELGVMLNNMLGE